MAITVSQPQAAPSLVPVCIKELFNGANELALGISAGCRTFKAVMEGTERTVIKLDQITSTYLANQHEMIMKTLPPK